MVCGLILCQFQRVHVLFGLIFVPRVSPLTVKRVMSCVCDNGVKINVDMVLGRLLHLHFEVKLVSILCSLRLHDFDSSCSSSFCIDNTMCSNVVLGARDSCGIDLIGCPLVPLSLGFVDGHALFHHTNILFPAEGSAVVSFSPRNFGSFAGHS
jgi:hypothetical protein